MDAITTLVAFTKDGGKNVLIAKKEDIEESVKHGSEIPALMIAEGKKGAEDAWGLTYTKVSGEIDAALETLGIFGRDFDEYLALLKESDIIAESIKRLSKAGYEVELGVFAQKNQILGKQKQKFNRFHPGFIKFMERLHTYSGPWDRLGTFAA